MLPEEKRIYTYEEYLEVFEELSISIKDLF